MTDESISEPSAEQHENVTADILLEIPSELKHEDICDPDKRIFFVVKYWIMINLQTVIFSIVIFCLGTINFLQAVVVGLTMLFITFLIGRHFDTSICKVALKVTNGLERFPTVKRAIIKYM